MLVPAVLLAVHAAAAPADGAAAGTLLIIAPDRFHASLKEYVAAKQRRLSAQLLSLEDVLEKPPGVDDPEKVKRYPPSIFFQGMQFMVFGDPSMLLPAPAQLKPIASVAPPEGEPPAGVLVLTLDAAIRAKDVLLPEGGQLQTLDPAANAAVREIPREDLLLLRFLGPRADRPPGAWLCLKDGRRLRDDAIRLARDAVTLQSSAGQEITSAPLREIAAIHFRSSDPSRTSPPSAGVRVLSVDGEPLDAPSVTLADDSVTVEIDPSLDPVRFPLDRLSGLVWAEESGEPAGSQTKPASKLDEDKVLVELRSGERRKGELVSLDTEALLIRESGAVRAIRRRDLESVWFGSHRGTLLDRQAPHPPPGPERPLWRIGQDVLGGPLRLGERTCETGLGLRAPASVDVPVPKSARWLVARAGASAGAAPFARVTIEILVDGKPAARTPEKRPGSPAEEFAVPVGGASTVTIRALATGADSTGACGGIGDALFVE